MLGITSKEMEWGFCAKGESHSFMGSYLRISNFLIIVVLTLVLIGCEKGITGPGASSGNIICYEKSYNGHWEIFTNNIAGSDPQDVSNYSDDDEYPQWSPDGRYIVYSRSVPVNGPLIYVYDVESKISINLTSDGGGASQMPQWAPNGKVYFGYPYFWAKYRGTYIMNPDGTDRKKILDSTATIYFYNDSYNFLYVVDYTKVYKSNIDNANSEFLFDISQTLNQQGALIQGFNPLADEFLTSPKTADGKSVIATYGIRTRSLNILLAAEEGYTFFQMKYSKDFSKIAFVEHSSNDEYLSVLENGVKKRLVRIPASTPPVNFSYEPMQFSPDGRYIAFSKQVFQAGSWVSWAEYLYAVDVTSGAVQSIDEGFYPSWNPRP